MKNLYVEIIETPDWGKHENPPIPIANVPVGHRLTMALPETGKIFFMENFGTDDQIPPVTKLRLSSKLIQDVEIGPRRFHYSKRRTLLRASAEPVNGAL